MEQIINTLNGIIWSKPLVYLCLGAGLFFSVITRFVQLRHFFNMWKLMFNNKSSPEGISSFQALTVALSGRVGMGNIAGVSAAIGFGGPGAVFWMWVVAFFGAASAYVEATLGQIYKTKDPISGHLRGGPAYYFEKCLGGPFWKAYAFIFAVAMMLSCGIFLPGVQANGVAEAVVKVVGDGALVNTQIAGEVGTNKLVVLAIILLVLGFIIFGGIKRIASFAQYVVPFMALAYIILALIIVFIEIGRVPEMFALIFHDAFSPQAGLGAAIGWGVKRGVYSNEAGQGTAPHHAAAAVVDHPAEQGIVQAFSVYVDTLFVCTATALMILLTGKYNIMAGQLFSGTDLASNVYLYEGIKDTAGQVMAMNPNSPAFTQTALESVFGGAGPIFVSLAVFFFAFTTILAYYYIAESNIAYLAEKVGMGSLGLFIVKVMVMCSVAYGVLHSSGYIWDIGDIGVGGTAWLNIVGILALFFMAKPTVTCLRDYEAQKKAGGPITFNPKALGIKHATFWEEKYEREHNGR